MKKLELKHILLCIFVFFMPILMCGFNKGLTSYDEIEIVNVDSIRRDSIKNLMIEEVSAYINTYTSKSYEGLPAYLVEQCLENDLQVAFALSQTHLETCFGTTGIGRATSRKSIFGVMRSYDTYEECVDKYISLVKNSYLVNGKTEQSMLNNYVNKSGYRYAEEGYEARLRRFYGIVTSKTNLVDLQNEYNNI